MHAAATLAIVSQPDVWYRFTTNDDLVAFNSDISIVMILACLFTNTYGAPDCITENTFTIIQILEVAV